MNRHIVSFYAILDNYLKVWGMIRVPGMYDSDVTKSAIEIFYRSKFPRKNEIAITILSIDEVSQEEYDYAANSSIDLA